MEIYSTLSSYVSARGTFWAKVTPVCLVCVPLFTVFALFAVVLGNDNMVFSALFMLAGYVSFLITTVFDYQRQKAKNPLPAFTSWLNFALCAAFFLAAGYVFS